MARVMTGPWRGAWTRFRGASARVRRSDSATGARAAWHAIVPLMAELTREADLVQILGRARVVAVIGAHSDTVRPAGFVPEYLHEQGYRVLPVNPRMVGQTLWGEPVVARLTDLAGPIDLVDVFRRSDALPTHMDDFLSMDPARTAIWFQAGIRNDEVAAALVARGYDVVQDRCTLAEHRRFRASGLLPLKEAKPAKAKPPKAKARPTKAKAKPVKAKARPAKAKPERAAAKGRAPGRRGPGRSS